MTSNPRILLEIDKLMRDAWDPYRIRLTPHILRTPPMVNSPRNFEDVTLHDVRRHKEHIGFRVRRITLGVRQEAYGRVTRVGSFVTCRFDDPNGYMSHYLATAALFHIQKWPVDHNAGIKGKGALIGSTHMAGGVVCTWEQDNGR